MRALIVDDDESMAKAAQVLLSKDNIESDIADISQDILAQARAQTYDVILLDIMMPNVDGLELCGQIKSDDALKHVKVAIVSAKNFEMDKRRAKEVGANGYFVKPLDVNSFVKNVRAIVDGTYTVRYWGVRGTLPVPGPKSLRYGGNTPCVSMRIPHERYLIFDAGSGIKALSDHLMERRKGKISAHMFISHPHWDHINAFPFFAPFHVQGNTFDVIGAKNGDRSMQELFQAQMDGVFFPIMVEDMGAAINFRDIAEETVTIDDDITVQSMLLSHPGNCLGYRVTFNGKSVCYITDNELYTEESGLKNETYEEKLIDFIRESDILITDTTYFDEDYPNHVNWGHSPVSRVVDIAAAAQVKNLHLFHHDPDQFDDDIDRKLEVARGKMAALNGAIEVHAPSEGSVYQL